MDYSSSLFLTVIAAYVLDRYFGDPPVIPHPVRIIGNGIDNLEALGRKFLSRDLLLLWGLLCVCGLSILVWIIVDWLTSFTVIGYVIGIYFAYSGLALKNLLDEGRAVERLVLSRDLEAARLRLAMIVSRDTTDMSEQDIRRSIAETVSENFSDGFLAPLFYLFLFGPTGMWVYKTVNTFDSMWGYKNDRYRQLGMFPARLDDVLNWIPARLSALLLVLTGITQGSKATDAASEIVRDAPKMSSPNAGWPMAAAAWIVGGRMGGATRYNGEMMDKPAMGPEKSWTQESLFELFSLVDRAGLVSVISLALLYLVITF